MINLNYLTPAPSLVFLVNLILPVTFLLVCGFLVTFPFYVSPWETGMGIAITLTGIPVYMITIYWRNKPKFYKKAIGKITSMVQKLLLSVPEENGFL
ncbi:Large neutral amino acids transporter small like protein [Argiope bruennichi]|uniref:Large neutral amino acids transporter small like protein n=1 Tax=Argiope bruennichi TaxID=94029 RepID=A0A8T0FRC0_ARGBR|nr:Large neutral amino acids transporter small like protein [Argiope bruennichi]